MRCWYLVRYVSAVTGRVSWSGCADKRMADKEAAALMREGCKGVEVHKYREGQ